MPKSDWDLYLEKLNACCNMVKLVAYHTKIAGEKTEEVSKFASLISFHINEYLNKIKE